MTTVIGVSFKRAGKVYWFDPNGLTYKDGLGVIVETARGVEYGEVCGGINDVPDEMVIQPLKKVVRIATEEDISSLENNRKREKEAFGLAQEKIAKHGLEMKLVDVEYAFDGSRIVFFFTANGRVDFRELVKDMASLFRTRIELRQIGVRDEAKMLGGLGPCGRPICCRQFLPDFQPVSIRMAKEQNLSLNPTKISGLCGRLMCCLKYEQDTYEAARKRVPRVGREVVTADGPGHVLDINALKEKLRVKVQLKDGTIDIREYAFEEIARKGEEPPTPIAPEKEEASEEDDFAVPQERPAPPVQRPPKRPAQPQPPRRPAPKPPQDKAPPAAAGEDSPQDKESDATPARKRRNRRRPRTGGAPKGAEPGSNAPPPTA